MRKLERFLKETKVSDIRAGVLVFYACIGIYSLMEYAVPGGLGGAYIVIGRVMGCILGGAMVLQGLYGMSGAEVRLELDGDPREPLWFAANWVFIWGGLAAAVYHVCRLQYWDAIMVIMYPAWQGALRLELRRRDVVTGELKPAGIWFALLYLSCAVFVISFFMMFVPGGGPIVSTGPRSHEYFRLIPLITMISVPAIVLSLVGTAGKFLP